MSEEEQAKMSGVEAALKTIQLNGAEIAIDVAIGIGSGILAASIIHAVTGAYDDGFSARVGLYVGAAAANVVRPWMSSTINEDRKKHAEDYDAATYPALSESVNLALVVKALFTGIPQVADKNDGSVDSADIATRHSR